MVGLFTKHSVPKGVCEALAARTERYSGSDLKSVCKELVMDRIRASAAFQRGSGQIDVKSLLKRVGETDVEALLARVKPSPCCDLGKYSGWAARFGST